MIFTRGLDGNSINLGVGGGVLRLDGSQVGNRADFDLWKVVCGEGVVIVPADVYPPPKKREKTRERGGGGEILDGRGGISTQSESANGD